MKNKNSCKSGFTLIELLVVVLIIGILASIALPQYQKAVEKSKATQALSVLNTYYQSYQTYYMAAGAVPTRLDELDVEMPWNGRESWAGESAARAVSNEDWALQLYTNVNNFAGICMGRLRGEYKGAGFCKFRLSPEENITPDTLYCAEKKYGQGILFQKRKGDYCKKILKGTYVGSSTFYFFSLP